MVDYREILRLKSLGYTMKDIASSVHSSRNTVSEVLTLAYTAYMKDDVDAAKCVEPLEQVVDELKAEMRNRHINRLKRGECSIEAGFVWADLITNLERTAEHCSNVAVCVIDAKAHNMNMHESIKSLRKNNSEFDKMYDMYAAKYSIL